MDIHVAAHRGRTFGLVLDLPEQQFGEEPYYHELIAGIENVLLPAAASLIVKIVSDPDRELATYREWSASGVIDGVFLVNLVQADTRVSLLEGMGMPAVVVGSVQTAGVFPAVWTDDRSAMRLAVHRLYELGHRRLGRVSGPEQLAHSQSRTESFQASCRDLGVLGTITTADAYTEVNGRAATQRLIAEPMRPTAIIYDDDVMAIGGLGGLAAAGLDVPHDVSVLAWDDSAFCQLSTPPLSVMGHDVQAIGELCAESMLALRAGRRESHEGPMATFVQRESVAAVGVAREHSVTSIEHL